MSATLEAFRETVEAAAEETGKRQTVKIRGKEIDAIVSELEIDRVLILGGNADRGGFSAEIAQEDLTGEPKALEPIDVNGRRLSVLSFTNRQGATWNIESGDPVSERA